MAEPKTKKPKSVEELVASLRSPMVTVQGLSTGNVELDHITSVGGYPKGRITEQFGPPSSGKTTSAMQAMGLELARCDAEDDGYVMLLDFEMALDGEYARALGVDIDSPRFIYVRPTSFEDGAARFRAILETGELRMATFDSVAAMVTESEQDAATGKANIADRAKLMHQFARQIKAPLEKHDCAAVFINHTMDLVDTSPMGQRMSAQGIKRQTQPGGKALPFYASLRIEFKQIGQVKDEVEDDLTREKVKAVRQMKVLAKVVKNKVGDPFREAELRIRFGRGFSQEHSVLTVLVNHKIVKKSGGSFKFPDFLLPEDGKIPFGENNVVSAMERDQEWTSRLLEAAAAALESSSGESVESSEGQADEDLLEYDYDEETGEVL